MKRKNLILTFLIGLVSTMSFAQDIDWAGATDAVASNWEGIRGFARVVVGLIAAGSAIFVYVKMTNDEGGSGKKSLLNFVAGILFFSIAYLIIDLVFFG